MKHISSAIAAVFCLVALTGCGSTEKQNVLTVSVAPQQALLEEIVGNNFEIVTMLTPGSNPETFEPGMNTRRGMESSKAYFTTGYLPFEEKLEASSGNSVLFVNTSAGIEPVYGTHSHSHGGHHGHSHSHANADPHVWTSVKNARVMAKNMYDAVVAIDPDNGTYYTDNYNRLAARLDSLDAAFSRKLSADGAGKAFAIWHPSLSYLARDYGLAQIAVGYENKEMPAAVLRKTIDEAKADGVKVFFFQKEFDSRQAETLNAEMGTRLVTINPLDYEWEAQLDSIVSALCR